MSNETWQIIWRSWDVRPGLVLFLLLLAGLFGVGWWRLRSRSRSEQSLATVPRLLAYWGGLLLVGVALMSPIDILSEQSFTMHMIQHLMLIMVAPPLLTVANPFPFIMWGMPRPVRKRVGRGIAAVFNAKTGFRTQLRTLTNPGAMWMLFTIQLWAWHDPAAYNAALESPWIHDLEHISFFGAAMLYWWHVTAAGPRIHKRLSYPARVAYVAISIPPNMLTGMVLAFATTPYYSYYLNVPRLWESMSVLDDQILGGVIMWAPGSMMYVVATIVVLGQWLRRESHRAALEEA